MNKKITAIVQARIGSDRLRGKVIKKINGKETILLLLKRLSLAKKIDDIIVAIPKKRQDDVLYNILKKNNFKVFRGSEKNVLSRYYQCAKKFSSEIIVRITADNPLIDPNIVDNVINQFLKNSFDYITNANPRTYPYGTEVEVFSFQALEEASNNAEKPSEREHVTPYFQNNRDKFKISAMKYSENISHLRWTVDRENDLKFVRKIVSRIKKRPILMTDIIKLISQEPTITSINNTNIP